MNVEQIILIVVIGLLVIAYPILVGSRNKKEKQRMQEQTDSLKRGDRVITSSGVYGTIVDLEMSDEKKIVTIETGTGKRKGYISVDAYSIYTVFTDAPAEAKTENKDAKTENKDAKADNKDSGKTEEPKQEKKDAKGEGKTEEPVDKKPIFQSQTNKKTK